MFSKLRDKLKKITKKISSKAEVVEEQETKKEEKQLEEEKEIKRETKQEREKNKEKEPEKEEETNKEEKKETKKIRLIKKKISEKAFNEVFDELELDLLEANIALEVVEKIRNELKERIVGKELINIEEQVSNELKSILRDILDQGSIDLLELSNEHKPLIIAFFGVNGTGKTTTIAKIAKIFLDNNKKVVIAASDTYRAASIEQLEEHAKRLGVRVIKHDYGSDPAAVAFDAIQHAKAKGIDVVLIDTAGRMHSNKNLMEELRKIVRVAKPHLRVLVLEGITGNDSVIQAEEFNKEIGIDAIILTKMDIDEKGGTAISVSYITKKPIIYIGIGQEYKDLKRFNVDEIINTIIG